MRSGKFRPRTLAKGPLLNFALPLPGTGAHEERFMDVVPLHLVSQAAVPAEVSGPAGQVGANREVVEAVHAVNAAELFGQDSELTFSLDRATRRAIIRIVNRKTNEVIRQIPAEYVLRLAQAIREGGASLAAQLAQSS
jgi:FlaG protein